MEILESYIEKGHFFAIKADNGKYLTSDSVIGSTIEASKEVVTDADCFCHFYVEKIDKNTIALKTASQIYLSRYSYENVFGERFEFISVSKTAIDEQCKFKIYFDENDLVTYKEQMKLGPWPHPYFPAKILLQTDNGKFLSRIHYLPNHLFNDRSNKNHEFIEAKKVEVDEHCKFDLFAFKPSAILYYPTLN